MEKKNKLLPGQMAHLLKIQQETTLVSTMLGNGNNRTIIQGPDSWERSVLDNQLALDKAQNTFALAEDRMRYWHKTQVAHDQNTSSGRDNYDSYEKDAKLYEDARIRVRQCELIAKADFEGRINRGRRG